MAYAAAQSGGKAVRVLVLPLLSAFGISGCATFNGPIQPDVPTESVVKRVECEIGRAYQALRTDHPWLDGWAVKYTLTLTRSAKASASSAIDYATLISGGSFGFGAVGAVGGEGARVLDVTRPVVLARSSAQCPLPPSSAHPILGDLGIAETLAEALESHKGAGEANIPSSLGYKFDFEIGASASGGPGWSFVRLTGLGVGAAVESKRKHALALAFVKNEVEQPVIVSGTGEVTTTRRRVPRRATTITPDASREADNVLFQLQFKGTQPQR